MKTTEIRIGGRRVPLHSLNTLIIGSGAAALNAAVSLRELGTTDIALVTDSFGGGTSFNTGSDKQTYYKLSLAGDRGDSVVEMARDLCAGGGMHGDIALCEAAGSVRAFFNLVRLGVPFPHDPQGAFIGYKTDHDPRRRATSAGPLTSKFMSEALAGEARKRKIRVFDRHPVVGLLTAPDKDGRKVVGAVALDATRSGRKSIGLVVFNAVNIVLGTGGPAGIYKTSVYPESQTGSHGLAFEIGATGHNLTEWQFGLASIKFRWNLSGTYQQAIPRYISTDKRGRDEREFLADFFPDAGRAATAVFLKGYQWPFDPRKIAGYGSSLIDVLVHRETVVKGRRVFLDFRSNPAGLAAGLDGLDSEARRYLELSSALLGTPIERLLRMNPPAVDLYLRNGIDLAAEPLEIGVCAQHNNGGLKGNAWWESNIRRLFPVGEANGTHGVYRPGGSALNAGQVGSFRAAQFIARRCGERPPSPADFLLAAGSQIEAKWNQARMMMAESASGRVRPEAARSEFQARMTAVGAHIRNPKAVGRESKAAWRQLDELRKSLRVGSAEELPEAFRTLDLCLTQAVYLEALKEYLSQGGRSRGSYIVLDPAGDLPCPGLGDEWRYSLAEPGHPANRRILEIGLDGEGKIVKSWVEARPIPSSEDWFETVWADFRADRIIR
jgi:succinate dehydrogenase/fumarate reductase flavoprotein subunit